MILSEVKERMKREVKEQNRYNDNAYVCLVDGRACNKNELMTVVELHCLALTGDHRSS